jgi:hypothetical protein
MAIESDEPKLERLRAMVDEGIKALDGGEFVEIDDTELDAYLDSLATGVRVSMDRNPCD